MDKLLAYITDTLREICTEAYHDRNTAKKVVYPYCTFDIQSAANFESQQNQEQVSLDVDIFDINPSYDRILEIESAIKRELAYKRFIDDNFGVIWKFIRANTIPTGQEQLLRRSLQLQLIIDWRQL